MLDYTMNILKKQKKHPVLHEKLSIGLLLNLDELKAHHNTTLFFTSCHS